MERWVPWHWDRGYVRIVHRALQRVWVTKGFGLATLLFPKLGQDFLSFPLHFTSKAPSPAMLSCMAPSPVSQSLPGELIAILIRMIVMIDNKQFFQMWHLVQQKKQRATKAIKNPRQDWNLKKANHKSLKITFLLTAYIIACSRIVMCRTYNRVQWLGWSGSG